MQLNNCVKSLLSVQRSNIMNKSFLGIQCLMCAALYRRKYNTLIFTPLLFNIFLTFCDILRLGGGNEKSGSATHAGEPDTCISKPILHNCSLAAEYCHGDEERLQRKGPGGAHLWARFEGSLVRITAAPPPLARWSLRLSPALTLRSVMSTGYGSVL